MKKKIKIKICDFDSKNTEESFGTFFIQRLAPFYDVELSDQPDYVFFYERTSEYLKYPDAIRIFYTGENISPDFNLTDYSIAFDRLVFGDRHFRLPLYMVTMLYGEKEKQETHDLTFETYPKITTEDLKQKEDFCSFVYSNHAADPRRKEMFDVISSYKKVNSGGKYLNNVDGPVPDKLTFQRKHKFSIAFENSSRPGYSTEKLPACLLANTIPIYYGNPDIGKEFNTDRFINAHDFPSFEAVLERVKEIDNNDEEYLRIANQPVLAEGFHISDTLSEFDKFLQNIFDQQLEKAKRRTINTMHADLLEKREIFFCHYQKIKVLTKKIFKPVYNLYRKLRS